LVAHFERDFRREKERQRESSTAREKGSEKTLHRKTTTPISAASDGGVRNLYQRDGTYI